MNFFKSIGFGAYGDSVGFSRAYPGEFGQNQVTLQCPSGGIIKVVQATYGSNCNKPELQGNKTAKMQTSCDGQSSCTVQPQLANDPDPAWGCPKDFNVDWVCSTPTPIAASFPVLPPAAAIATTLPASQVLIPQELPQGLPAPSGSSGTTLIFGGAVIAIMIVLFIFLRKRKKKALLAAVSAAPASVPSARSRKH